MADVAPPKPRIRMRSVVGTVLGIIGTGGTIVGGAILTSFHKMTIDDHHKRIAAGVPPIVVGAVMIVISLVIGAMDAYELYTWWQWRKAHPSTTHTTTTTTSTRKYNESTETTETTDTTEHMATAV